jgi:hypothetical protein
MVEYHRSMFDTSCNKLRERLTDELRRIANSLISSVGCPRERMDDEAFSISLLASMIQVKAPL